MSPKDLLFDFLNLIFMVVLVGFCIFYFIAGDHFAVFALIMKSMMPLAFFGILFLIKLKMTRQEIKKRTSENNTDIVLYLTVMKKLASDIFVFGTPIILGLLIYSIRGLLDIADIAVLILIFLIMYFWQRYLFSQER